MSDYPSFMSNRITAKESMTLQNFSHQRSYTVQKIRSDATISA